MILLRTLHRDIARYNRLDEEEDAQEEFGWKLVHGDIFRPPRHALLLSVFVGSGSNLHLKQIIFYIIPNFYRKSSTSLLFHYTCFCMSWFPFSC
jgi:transmembrane 9 superfamily protein 2/4